MKDFYFVLNDANNAFELWVGGECITDCFSLVDNEADLMKQLVHFADVPCYKRVECGKDFNWIIK